MRVLFLGSGAFGLPTLRAIADHHQLVGVVTQPDKPAGRSRKLTPTPIGVWAQEHTPGVSLEKPASVNEESVRDRLRAIEADAWVVIAFGQKLGKALLADRFAVNLHASRLPRWRGAAPIHAAVLAGDTETGNSVITLAERMDAGLILGQSRRPIEAHQTSGDLHDLLAEDGPELMLDVLARHEAGTLEPMTQDEARVTLAGKLSKGDGWADFAGEADGVRRRVQGLNPWPGVTVTFRGEPLKLHRVEVAGGGPETRTRPGSFLDPALGLVTCGSGVIRLIEVQPAGRKPMPYADFARGSRPEAGETLAFEAGTTHPEPRTR
ncbi:MAG: methionyl-tRNA formyltransferase [Phycisphaerales bacterium]|nr:MAG: methionyl-tRNA formyltransferase [Phycisphaerales bacterium]